jgi:hypothetical protein
MILRSLLLLLLLLSSYGVDMTLPRKVVATVVPAHDTVQRNNMTRSSRFSTNPTPPRYIRMNHNDDDPTFHVTDDGISPDVTTSSSTTSMRRDLSDDTTHESINPYTSGCLHAKELVSQIRVCNSEDPVEAVKYGICRLPEVDYMEIRIFSDNWESITFEAWILQIILSEMLDVPTTIEAGSYEGLLNFYHPDAPMVYGTTTGSIDALQLAYDLGDCRNAKKVIDNYQPCAHIDPEQWNGTLVMK